MRPSPTELDDRREALSVEIGLFATREAGTRELRSLFREPSSGGVKWLESTATSASRGETPT
jgi:hypothetical protein